MEDRLVFPKEPACRRRVDPGREEPGPIDIGKILGGNLLQRAVLKIIGHNLDLSPLWGVRKLDRKIYRLGLGAESLGDADGTLQLGIYAPRCPHLAESGRALGQNQGRRPEAHHDCRRNFSHVLHLRRIIRYCRPGFKRPGTDAGTVGRAEERSKQSGWRIEIDFS